jgi:hypothetical protein
MDETETRKRKKRKDGWEVVRIDANMEKHGDMTKEKSCRGHGIGTK